MKLELYRYNFGDTYTEGRLYIDGKYAADTIEPRTRTLRSEADKIKHKTSIPYGEYRVVMSYSPRFRCLLPELLSVPYFSGIRIHSGNDASDTSGCILCGTKWRDGYIIGSRVATQRVIEKIKAAHDSREIITIDIKCTAPS